jgi:hypothetical protein
MSLYCATGDVESDLVAQLQDLLAESLRSWEIATVCWSCPPTTAACTRARAI